MKTKIAFLIGVLTVSVLTVFVTGCVHQSDQVLEKSTVFGFQAKTPGGQGYSTTIQIGLVRNEFWKNPTSTNLIYAAPYSSHVDAKLSALSQTAKEDFSTKPQTVNDTENPTNTTVNVVTGP
jgi:hypothetical protein